MRILSFGSLNLDYVYQVDHIVKPGETVSSHRLDVYCGGKGLNQSIALARAGAEAYLAGAIGPDGDMLRDAARESGVNITLLRRVETRTGNAIIQCSTGGENSIILYGGANQCNDGAYIDEVLTQLDSGDMILLQNEINGIAEIMRKASAKGIKIALNPSPFEEKLRDCPLELVSYFILNEVEGQAFTGKSEPEEILASLKAMYLEARIVLTLGRNGVLYWDSEQTYRHGVYDVEVQDTTGAGDTFTGYFLTAEVQGLQPHRILELASKASAMAVAVPGAVPSIPKRSEVEDWQGSLG